MDSLLKSLPDKIRNVIEGKSYTTDDIGKSGSKVLIFEDNPGFVYSHKRPSN